MTREDVHELVRIFETADGSCFICAAKLVAEFVKTFPQYEPFVLEVYDEDFRRIARGDF